ncbi:PKD domain-containing protein [Methanoculleus taiwanensis]|uniref:PKD domain-containing protein n=1 Tax=Methanoculleus taiwanensis TaxID=1550565 RepID=UPI00240CE8C5|nr:PKD domain-containing protein [Methanoculleus taiwanensis]
MASLLALPVLAAPGIETPICTAAGSQVRPDIDGSLIVWADYRSGDAEIYLYDLTTDVETRITTNPSRQTSPSISGSRIVWEDNRNGNLDIYLYDLTSDQEIQLTNAVANQWNPIISGDRAIWYDVRNSGMHICLYDIPTGTEILIPCSAVTTWKPAISGNLVAWEDNRDGNGEIYAYDILEGKQIRITDDPARQTYPAISGRVILWEDERNGSPDIYLFDLATGVEERITDNAASQVSPAIDGDLIAWEDRRNGNWDICIYDRPTGTETLITTAVANQWFPSVSGDRVVWEDLRSGVSNPDIYLYTVTGGDLLTASFSASPTSGEVPLDVQFTDSSSGSPTSWLWDFGDGTTSDEQNPVHTYTEVGTYTVSLTATDGSESSTEEKVDLIRVAVLPDAGFDANVSSGMAPLTVGFTDLSTGEPTAWSWEFGDGATSTEQNPVHTYAAAGAYTVSLNATNAAGSDIEEQIDLITVTEPVNASFTANATSGATPLTIQFTDTSTGAPTSWSWDFGDGATSTEQSPVHTYTAEGTYTVSLTATNAVSDDTRVETDYIVATVFPGAGFDVNVSSGMAPLTVQFTDLSTGEPTAWSWEFGDGATSTEQNPVHTYAAAGAYTVTLNATNAAGSDIEEQVDLITAIGPVTASFTANVTGGVVPFAVGFTDTSTGAPTSWSWDFGDGATSTEQSPVHIYTVEGTYTVSLTATNAVSDDTLVETDLITATALPGPSFDANVTEGGEPLVVAFTDTSTDNPTAWSWEFGDGATSTEQNPVHTYAAAGAYTVSLAVTNAVGSATEEKVGYIRVFVPPSANFTADVSSGTAPLTVQFTDLSIGEPTSWLWDFGDGATSAEQHPTHAYPAGTFTVSLTVSNPAGGNTTAAADSISVSPAPVVSSSSGGGGGGKRASSMSPPTPTVTPEPVITNETVTPIGVNASGIATCRMVFVSSDNVAALLLDEGVRALCDSGTSLESISVDPIDAADLPASPNGIAVLVPGYAYQFGPEGASFDPAVTVTFTLPDEIWDEHIAGNSTFSVKWYNGMAGVWEDIPATVDDTTRTVSASIDHFSIYALFTESPAADPLAAGVVVLADSEAVDSSGGLPFMQIALGLCALFVLVGGAYIYAGRHRQ